MKKLTALLAILLMGCMQPNFNAALSSSTELKTGKLENGLTYFILPNSQPQNRVYIRLVVNAGSMHEDDDQKGVAHIVEHMAFNGSEKFPKNQIIHALEKLGMKFARDINAFTDFENTVYILNMDKNDLNTLSLALDILNEWINRLTIFPDDLDNERGIVLEEWRARLSPMLRLGDKKSAIEMANSRYVKRDPIGTVDVIKQVSHQRVNDFYRKWYRPDNMSVIIVGDIQPTQIHRLLAEKFTTKNDRTFAPTLPVPPLNDLMKKIDFRIPLIPQWRLETVAEKGIYTPAVEFEILQDSHPQNNLSDYRETFIREMMTRLINLRLQHWEKRYPTLIQTANFYENMLGKQTRQQVFSLQLEQENHLMAIAELFKFIAIIKQQGFTQQEFDHEILRLTQLNERQRKIRSGSLKLADDLIPIAANGQIYLDPEQKYQLNKNLLSTLSLNEINTAFKNMIEIPSKLLLLTQSYPPKKLNLSVSDIQERWQQQLNHRQENWQTAENKAEMPKLALKKGKILAKNQWKNGNITEYQLSNGSRLIYRYTDKTPEQVHFRAVTSGGLRSVPKNRYHELRSAATLVDNSGIGKISQPELIRLFGHEPLVFTTLLDDEKQGFIAAGKNQALEKILTLFHLKLQSSPINPQEFTKYKKEHESDLKNLDSDEQFFREVNQLRFPTIPTPYDLTNQKLNTFRLEALENLYQSVILNKTDFTYFIVGDIEQSAVESLAENYLANIEVKRQDRAFYPAKAVTPTSDLVRYGLDEPRADVTFYLTTDQALWAVPSAEKDMLLDILGNLIQEQLRLDLREKESGVYAVSSWFTQDKNTQQMEGRIEFSCAPQRVKDLISATENILENLRQNGVPQLLLAKKTAEKQQELNRQFDTALSMMEVIEYSLFNHDDTLLNHSLPLNATQIQDKINRLAAELLKKEHQFKAILLPVKSH